MKIIVYYGADKQWHVHIKSRNGCILLDAGGYNTAANARKMLGSVAKGFAFGKYSIIVESRSQPKKK